MSVGIPIYISRNFEVKASLSETWKLLVDVPLSVGHFPKVQNLADLGDGKYRWDMQRIGNNRVSIQVVYACRYVPNPSDHSIIWTPVPGIGNSMIKGHWKMRDRESGGTSVELFTGGDITLPVPKLLSAVAKPIVANEFGGLVDIYVTNLKRTLGGG